MTDAFDNIAENISGSFEVGNSVLPTRRPFMIVVHSHRPAKDEQGKLIEGKIEVVETAHLEDRINQRLQEEATIIIDLLERKCVKRRFESVQSIDEEPIILAHYVTKYKEKIKQACSVYLEHTKFSPAQETLVRSAIRDLENIK